ncbi:MAG: hypothetical protein FJ040_07980 [Chloroflexi bacterium]|nr:hypothetical protein [Chloroflexota bacterium]
MAPSFWPRTRIGWVAAVSFISFVVLYIINGYMLKVSGYGEWWLADVLPFYGLSLGATVFASSIGGVIALFGRDNAWTVRAATLPIFGFVFVRIMIMVLNALHL